MTRLHGRTVEDSGNTTAKNRRARDCCSFRILRLTGESGEMLFYLDIVRGPRGDWRFGRRKSVRKSTILTGTEVESIRAGTKPGVGRVT